MAFVLFSIQGLPIKCVHGKVSKLVIKIPWFNIFTKSTTIEIEGVHLLIVPSTSVSYDENKERDLAEEAKQKRLQVRHHCQFSFDVLEQWFSTLEARTPTLNENEHFGGPPNT